MIGSAASAAERPSPGRAMLPLAFYPALHIIHRLVERSQRFICALFGAKPLPYVLTTLRSVVLRAAL
jgi:hypothetical protein